MINWIHLYCNYWVIEWKIVKDGENIKELKK